MKDQILQAVEKLNQNLWDRFEDNNQVDSFYYITSGLVDSVFFNDECLWCSENDDRERIEGVDNRSGQYEEFLPFIKKKFNEYVDRITKFKFE